MLSEILLINMRKGGQPFIQLFRFTAVAQYPNDSFFDKYSRFVTKWFFSTNHKIIGSLYIYLGFVSGVIGTMLSFLIRLELSQSGS